MKDIRRRLKVYLILFVLLTLAGTLGFMALENISFADALYYNIVTMSTVGYGDIHPTSTASRFFAIFLIVMGGATFLGVIANATEILIVKRETRTRMRKVNMVLGAFFSEVGYQLIDLFSTKDKNLALLRDSLLLDMSWGKKEFLSARKALQAHEYNFDIDHNQLQMFHGFFKTKKSFLIDLIENPVLIENESFSEVLLALFHLMDELNSRDDLDTLPPSDMDHISKDFARAYRRLAIQWIDYLDHLKDQYPYLFSLAARKNPFDPKANPIVTTA